MSDDDEKQTRRRRLEITVRGDTEFVAELGCLAAFALVLIAIVPLVFFDIAQCF